jgi:hypothetical protein
MGHDPLCLTKPERQGLVTHPFLLIGIYATFLIISIYRGFRGRDGKSGKTQEKSEIRCGPHAIVLVDSQEMAREKNFY